MVNLLNKRVQFPRNTTRKNDAYIGPDGQVVVDNEKKELRLHDGKKKGGWAIVPLEMLKKLFLTRDTETGSLEFANDQSGLLTRIGTRDYALRTLEGINGIEITNPDGKDGNPRIGLSDGIVSLVSPTDDLFKGVQESPHLWSARELRIAMTRIAESLQTIEGVNTPARRDFNEIFSVASSGSETQTLISPSIGMLLNDRIEVVASATAVKNAAGAQATARIDIQRGDGGWDPVNSLVVSVLPNEESKTVSIFGRILKISNGYQIMDSNWQPISTYVQTLTGQIRVTTGIEGTAGTRISRWRVAS